MPFYKHSCFESKALNQKLQAKGFKSKILIKTLGTFYERKNAISTVRPAIVSPAPNKAPKNNQKKRGFYLPSPISSTLQSSTRNLLKSDEVDAIAG